MKKLLLLLMIVCEISACVPKSKYEDLQYELSRKESEISDLEDQVSQLESELEDCQSNYNELYNAAEALLSSYNSVIDDYNSLSSSYSSLYSFNNSVSSSVPTSPSVYGSTNQGSVVYEGRGDYYIVKTQMYYVLLETYGGWLTTGDVLAGDLHSYGFKDVLKNGNTTIRIYIENYWSNINRCYDWLRDHNKLK